MQKSLLEQAEEIWLISFSSGLAGHSENPDRDHNLGSEEHSDTMTP